MIIVKQVDNSTFDTRYMPLKKGNCFFCSLLRWMIISLFDEARYLHMSCIALHMLLLTYLQRICVYPLYWYNNYNLSLLLFHVSFLTNLPFPAQLRLRYFNCHHLFHMIRSWYHILAAVLEPSFIFSMSLTSLRRMIFLYTLSLSLSFNFFSVQQDLTWGFLFSHAFS